MLLKIIKKITSNTGRREIIIIHTEVMAVTLRQQFSSVCLKCVRRLIVKQLTPQSYVTSRWFGVQHRSKNFVSICHKTTSKQGTFS